MEFGRAQDYGVVALTYLASIPGARPRQVHDIATATGIPADYLRTLLARLKRAGLIKSVRGRNGGFLLASPPERITMLQVVEAIDGRLGGETLEKHVPFAAQRGSVSTKLRNWRHDVVKAFRDVLADTTIRDIVVQ